MSLAFKPPPLRTAFIADLPRTVAVALTAVFSGRHQANPNPHLAKDHPPMTELDPTAPSLPIRPRIGRRGVIIAALAVSTAGIAMNWGWLVAVGAAPLILSLAACAVMCGLGLCMMSGSKSCPAKTGSAEAPGSTTD